MIITTVGGFCEVTEAILKRADGTAIRYFSTSAEVVDFLRRNAGQDFLLESKRLGQILDPATTNNYGIDHGDIFCGQVKFDTQDNKVVCS